MQMNTDIGREKHTMKFGYKYMYYLLFIIYYPDYTTNEPLENLATHEQ